MVIDIELLEEKVERKQATFCNQASGEGICFHIAFLCLLWLDKNPSGRVQELQVQHIFPLCEAKSPKQLPTLAPQNCFIHD